MTTMSTTRAKKALPVTRLPHHRTIITSETTADASASCGHHPCWVKYPQETATKPTRGTNHSSPKIPSTTCPAPSSPEKSHERPALPPLQYPQELVTKSRCPTPWAKSTMAIRRRISISSLTPSSYPLRSRWLLKVLSLRPAYSQSLVGVHRSEQAPKPSYDRADPEARIPWGDD